MRGSDSGHVVTSGGAVSMRVVVPAVTVAAFAAASTPAPALGVGWQIPAPFATGMDGPLQLALTDPPSPAPAGAPRRPEAVIAAQELAGEISRVRSDGTSRDLVTGQAEVGGVAMRDGRVAFTVTATTPMMTRSARLKVRHADGATRTVAHLAAFEAEANPDHTRTYGFVDLAPACAKRVTDGTLRAEPYHGEPDSHPSALANAPGGGWYVADSGGNDILKVSPRGEVTVVYIARPQRAVVTEKAAASLGLPSCSVGATYAFEPVPTDVEVGRRGRLFVSLLPGGPETAALGAPGRILKVWPRTGRSVSLAGGFRGATNLALGAHHRIYVTELFVDRVSMVRVNDNVGVVEPDTVEGPAPAALEYRDEYLYIGYDVRDRHSSSVAALYRPGAIGR